MSEWRLLSDPGAARVQPLQDRCQIDVKPRGPGSGLVTPVTAAVAGRLSTASRARAWTTAFS